MVQNSDNAFHKAPMSSIGRESLCMSPLFNTLLEDGEDVDLGGRIS